MINHFIRFSLFLFSLSVSIPVFSQDNFTINLSILSGQKLNKENLHNFSILNNSIKSEVIVVRGSVKFRANRSTLNYQYQATLTPGLNQLQNLAHGVTYTYSSSTLEKLFVQQGALPNGEFEYCVDLFKTGGEGVAPLSSECIYDENEDLFLINLLEPEDKAKLSELYPMFSWTVNSPLINELSYKIRVAEIKDGQLASNAIMRNRPVYEQAGLKFLTQNYPVTGQTLEYFQPYAWTIDAYYKDILMGSAETWEFVIIDDSLMSRVPRSQPYVDLKEADHGGNYFALGQLKLKYEELDRKSNLLRFSIQNIKGQEIKGVIDDWTVKKGENFKVADLDSKTFKHGQRYTLTCYYLDGNDVELSKIIDFIYINPIFLK